MKKRMVARTVAAVCESLETRRLLSTVYVDAIAPGPGHNGSSWTKAYLTLQQALGVAVSGETIEVAQGTYTPTSGTDRTATFQLIDGVSILGGYGGETAVLNGGSANACNVSVFTTVLSGDIGIVGNNSDNSYNVVTGSGTNSTAVLDGFTISGGNSAFGAGMLNDTGSPTINDCTFAGNTAQEYGGGMYNLNSSPAMTNCVFIDNRNL